jgi:serine/alanine adding enzyme
VSGIVETAAPEWDDLLARLGCADVYYLSAYLASARLLEPGEPAFLHLEGDGGDVVFACLVREAPGGVRDVITPYGYGGPVATGPEPPVERFWELYERWCRGRGILTSFIRFHPLFANHSYAGPNVALERHADTTGWRLDLPDLFAGMDGKHRTSCRKARKEGVTFRIRQGLEDLSEFVALYEETMRRLGADDFYLFPQEYWDILTGPLREQVLLAEAVAGDEVAASALCFATQPWLHYHLSAASERGRPLGAGNLVLYETAEWARARRYERFHLGGGAGGQEDSLAAFKGRFDPGGRLEWWLGKAVHDGDAYRELTGRDPGDRSGFFPAYRQS